MGLRCGRLFLVLLAGLPPAVEAAAQEPTEEAPQAVRGMTISCQTWGQEWGRPAFDEELDRLAALGVNWIAIHPYARIRGDGTVSYRSALDEDLPPDWIARPLAATKARGMGLLVKPHLAYWGSPFRWRGEIRFDEPEQKARFWESYTRWILRLAEVSAGADAFAVGTELRGLLGDEAQWRSLVRGVRDRTDARLTYAANWDCFGEVSFWDALDAVGVQAYFPLSEREEPDEDVLRGAWERILPQLRQLHERTGKPVVFTELGYHTSLDAARQPWADRTAPAPVRERAEALQTRCLRVALAVIERESEWLRGAFLWKWFVGRTHERESFLVDTPAMRAVLLALWRGPVSAPSTAR